MGKNSDLRIVNRIKGFMLRHLGYGLTATYTVNHLLVDFDERKVSITVNGIEYTADATETMHVIKSSIKRVTPYEDGE